MDILSVLISLLAFTIAAVFSVYAWNRLRAVSYILIAWFVVAFGISRVPFFQSYTSWESGDLLGLTVFSTIMMIPLISLIWAWQKRDNFRAFLDNIPTWVLISTQLYRVAGFLLLAGYLQDKLPFEVGLVNGLLDIMVAILAIFFAGSIPTTSQPRFLKYFRKVPSLLAMSRTFGLLILIFSHKKEAILLNSLCSV